MSVLGWQRGEVPRRRRSDRTRRVRRIGLLLSVTLLCGAFYFAGIWSGAGSMTCVVSEPSVIRCGQGPAPPAVPATPDEPRTSTT
jgi:hypothetical protein